MKKNASFSINILLSLILLGLLVSLQMKNLNFNELQAYNEEQDLARLQEEAMALYRENNELSDANREMALLLDSMRDGLAGEDAALQAIIDEKEKAEIFAGLTDVKGPGLQVQLNEMETTAVKATTLLLLVNEMRTSGALAISINDERIVALTEIRDIGSENPQIVINGNSYPATISFVIKGLYPEEDQNRGRLLLNNLVDALKESNPSFAAVVTTAEQLTIPKLDRDSMGNR